MLGSVEFMNFVLCRQLWSLIWQVMGQLNMLVLTLVFAGSCTFALLALHRVEASCQHRPAHAGAGQDCSACLFELLGMLLIAARFLLWPLFALQAYHCCAAQERGL